MNFPGSGAAAGASGIDPNDPNMKKMAALMESCYAKTVMSGVMGFGLGGVFGLFMASMAYDTPYHTPTAAPTPTPAAGATAATSTGQAIAAAGKAAPGVVQTAPGTSIPSAATSATSSIPKPPPTIASTTSTLPTTSALPRPSPLAAATQAGAVAAAQTGSIPISSLPLKQQLQIGFRDMGARSWSSAKNFGKVGALFSGIECGIEGLRAKNDIGNGVAAGCVTGGILARNAGPQAAALGCAGFAAFSAAIEAWMRSPGDE